VNGHRDFLRATKGVNPGKAIGELKKRIDEELH
jgi:hypothetical protein